MCLNLLDRRYSGVGADGGDGVGDIGPRTGVVSGRLGSVLSEIAGQHGIRYQDFVPFPADAGDQVRSRTQT